MTNIVSKNTNNKSGYNKSSNLYNNWWLALIIYLGGALILGFIAYWGGYGKFGDIIVSGQSGFVIPSSIILILSIVGILACADAMFMTYKATNKNNYTRINTILYFCQLISFCFWPLFFYTLATAIGSSIFLAISIIIGIYLVYRFFCVSIYGGILYSLWLLWLLFLFVINFANFLYNI